jgi:fused signal recognition particle receptor
MERERFSEKLRRIFMGGRRPDSEEFFDDLMGSLIESDIGASFASETIGQLQARCKQKRLREETDIKRELKEIFLTDVRAKKINFGATAEEPGFYLFLGVNGVGKTTSIAKIAQRIVRERGAGSVLLAAGDTFRAGAIEQLKIHAGKLGVECVAREAMSDPGAVMHDAIQAGLASKKGCILADTAGRLQNKANLMRELEKIDKIVATRLGDDRPYLKFLVLDATTGQNALQQAEIFNSAVDVSAVILTKYDSVARGGVVISIGHEFGIPTAFLCTGEGYDDIQDFDPEAFLDEFLGIGPAE